MSTVHDPAAAQVWLNSPLGHYVASREQRYFDAAVADIFGYHALQLGMADWELLRASRIPMRVRVADSGDVGLRADFRDLPVETGSVDLMLLPHTLEYSGDPHQVVREAARVLRPEGRLLLSGFNPVSLWGLRRIFGGQQTFPWNGRFIQLSRVKDWFALLGLEIVAGAMAGYAPPCASQQWLDRFGFMEKAGDRWWPIGGGMYFLQAIKRVRGIRLIMPRWGERASAKKRLVAAPERVREQDAAAARSRAG